MSLSRKIAIAATTILFLAAGTQVRADSINSQIQSWTELNRACRGGSGDSPKTWEACKKREVAGALLKQHGLCQGKYNLEGFSDWKAETLAREKWIPCYYRDITEPKQGQYQ
jgi:hypothetical protein